MPLSTAAANDILEALMNAVPIANLLDNAVSSPATVFYLSLHTASPGSGNQSTSEISYTGYSRVSFARTSGGMSIAANLGTLVATATFGTMTAGAGGTVTHIGIGLGASGATYLLCYAAVTNLAVSNGSIPRILNTTTLDFV